MSAATSITLALAFHAAPALGTAPSSVGAWVTYWDYDRGLERLRSVPAAVDDVFFFVADLDLAGRPALARPELDLGVVRELGRRGVRTWLTVVNDRRRPGQPPQLKDAESVHEMLADAGRRAAHRRAILELAGVHGFLGVDLDYENLRPDDRDAFTAFVRELSADLKARGLPLSVTVQPKRQESRSVGPGAADWAQLCQAADRLQIMLYNLHSARTGPGPLATPAWIGEVLGFARSQCDPARVVPVLKVSGTDWGREARDLQHQDAVALLAQHGSSLEREAEGHAPFFRYGAADGAHTVYFEDAASVGRKLAALASLGFQRVVLFSLGREDRQILPALAARQVPEQPPED